MEDIIYLDTLTTQRTPHSSSSILFNTFVFLQLFNEINSRKIGAYEYNVFKGFFNNMLFLFIIVGTALVQIILVQYGG